MAALRADPVVGPKLDDPKVLKAVEEILRSPWKTVRGLWVCGCVDVLACGCGGVGA